MCTTQSEECFATKLGFRVGISITFGILVTAIICNVQVRKNEVLKKYYRF